VDAWESAEAFYGSCNIDETDCLILDINLPGRNGLQLQTLLHQSHHGLPIIFITALENERIRQQALATGAVDFIRKPVDSERLLEAIQNALEDQTRQNPGDG